ncbi:hypothetical protein QQX98_008602 [Neonectria punicea]|uniref:Uncharacterized protein n=1 Tax=Neonectria punicea TaxID=979145 RepID=A0ABR1GV37_9HYPO
MNTSGDALEEAHQQVTDSNKTLWTPEVDPMRDTNLHQSNPDDAFNAKNPDPFAPDPSFDGVVLGMSSVNWLSPQYQNTLEWDDQLAAISYGGIEPGDMGFYFPFNAAEAVRDPTIRSNIDVDPHGLNPSMVLPSEGQRSEPAEIATTSSPVSAWSSTGSFASKTTEGRFWVDGAASRAPFRGRLVRHLNGLKRLR